MFIIEIVTYKKLVFFKKQDFNNQEYKLVDDDNSTIANKDDLIEMRRIRLLDLKLWSILNEVGIFGIFLFLVYVVSFLNLNNSSYTYNQLFLSTFVHKQSPKEFGLEDVKISQNI